MPASHRGRSNETRELSSPTALAMMNRNHNEYELFKQNEQMKREYNLLRIKLNKTP